MTKKILKEINKLENLEIIVLSCFGHVGTDFVGNLFDSNKEILRIPPLNYFRKISLLKKIEKLDLKNIVNRNELLKIIFTKFLYKSPIKSYNIFKNNSQKKKFKILFNQYLKYSNERNLEKKFFFAIHYCISKLNKINILNKKYIFTQEETSIYCNRYISLFKTNFIFVIRDPRATFSGSFKNHKSHGINKSYGFDRVLGNWLTAYEFIKKINKNKIFILKNEKFQGKKNLKREMKKICHWLNINYSKSLEQPSYFGKVWYGDSSYLGKYEQSKPLPKNYYNLKNVKKRWKQNLSKNQILDIEMLLFKSMKKYGYRLGNKITINNLLNAYYRTMFGYKENYPLIKNIYCTTKNILRRHLIIGNALFASKIADLD